MEKKTKARYVALMLSELGEKTAKRITDVATEERRSVRAQVLAILADWADKREKEDLI